MPVTYFPTNRKRVSTHVRKDVRERTSKTYECNEEKNDTQKTKETGGISKSPSEKMRKMIERKEI